MVGNKFLQDDGEDDDVVCSEWAASGGLELSQLKKLEVEFLNAIVRYTPSNLYFNNKKLQLQPAYALIVCSMKMWFSGLERVCKRQDI